MLHYLLDLIRENPTVPIFLTLAVGFWLGSLKIKSFSLGPVTATLLVGVAVGQLDIPIAEPLKTVSFLLFLFAIGYRVGPQFFRSLKGDGVKQILFAVVEVVICVGVCILMARLMGYNTGTAIGLFAGSQTISAVIGVGTDTINSMKIDAETKKYLIGMIPSAYAVTYVFGTVGAAWICANLGPRLCGGLDKVKAEISELEAEMEEGEFSAQPGLIVANRHRMLCRCIMPSSCRSADFTHHQWRCPTRRTILWMVTQQTSHIRTYSDICCLGSRQHGSKPIYCHSRYFGRSIIHNRSARGGYRTVLHRACDHITTACYFNIYRTLPV